MTAPWIELDNILLSFRSCKRPTFTVRRMRLFRGRRETSGWGARLFLAGGAAHRQ